MSAPLFVILLVCFASVALADDFKTIDGKENKNAKVSRVEPDGLVLSSKSGISKVYFTELPKEVQERFGSDPGKADVHSAVQDAAPEPPPSQQKEEERQRAQAAEKNLSKEGSKKVTVASEIQRGYSAVIHLPLSGSFLTESEKILGVFERNKQGQTDSDGFMLGATFAEWLLSEIAAERSVSSINPANVAELARRFEADSFREWQQRAASMGLTDQQLCELVHADCNVVRSRIEATSLRH